MSSKSPIFPMPEPHHFSDYGFDPQIDYFRVLEEARKHKRETTSRTSIDTLHFKLQKPISRDDSKKIRKTKKRWWKNALLFFRRKWARNDDDGGIGAHRGRAAALRGSISGPVYITESRSGSVTPPYRTTIRPASGPVAGTLTPARKGELEIPYISLRELNMEPQHRISAPVMPVYLVT